MQSLVSDYIAYTYGGVFFCLIGLGAYVRFQKRQTRKFLTKWFTNEFDSKIKA